MLALGLYTPASSRKQAKVTGSHVGGAYIVVDVCAGRSFNWRTVGWKLGRSGGTCPRVADMKSDVGANLRDFAPEREPLGRIVALPEK